MLVFPDQPTVDLTYRWGTATYAGAGLAVGFLLCFVVPLGCRRTRPARPDRPIAPIISALLVTAVLAAAIFSHGNSSTGLFNNGVEAFQAYDFARAKTLFTAAANASPRSNSGIQSLLYLGLSHYKTEDWLDAAAAFRRLAEDFPENPSAPEALYHVGMSYQRAGQAGFAEYWRQTARLYPGTPWAQAARDRLNEAGLARQ
jgi:TolA-binding protein